MLPWPAQFAPTTSVNSTLDPSPSLQLSSIQRRTHTSPDIKNVGTGRIYGDQLALQADTILNVSETVNGITTAPVIAARDHLVIGTGTLENRDGGLIISAGDAVIGRRVEANNNSSSNPTNKPVATS